MLRKDLPALIKRLKLIDGVEDIALTTNGSLLKKFAGDLYNSGLSRVTVSLDSLDEERFAYMNGNRSRVKTVLEGMQAASEAGMKVKVNMVVQKGKNDQDIIPMAQYFKEKRYTCASLNTWMSGIPMIGNWMKWCPNKRLSSRLTSGCPLNEFLLIITEKWRPGIVIQIVIRKWELFRP